MGRCGCPGADVIDGVSGEDPAEPPEWGADVGCADVEGHVAVVQEPVGVVMEVVAKKRDVPKGPPAGGSLLPLSHPPPFSPPTPSRPPLPSSSSLPLSLSGSFPPPPRPTLSPSIVSPDPRTPLAGTKSGRGPTRCFPSPAPCAPAPAPEPGACPSRRPASDRGGGLEKPPPPLSLPPLAPAPAAANASAAAAKSPGAVVAFAARGGGPLVLALVLA